MKQIEFSEIQPGDVVRVEWSHGETSWRAQGPVRGVSVCGRRIDFNHGGVDVDNITSDELTIALIDRPAQWDERTLDEMRVGMWVRVNVTSGHIYDGRLRRVELTLCGNVAYLIDDGNVHITEVLDGSITKVEVRRP